MVAHVMLYQCVVKMKTYLYPVIELRMDSNGNIQMYNIKLGVLIPTRSNRPEFLEFAKQQISSQTLQPDVIEIVDDPPLNTNKDITWRYRIGCQRLFDKKIDIIVFWEDDDFYSSNYLKTMVNLWDANGRPSCIGLADTYYYHLGIRKWLRMQHPGRASAFSTLVSSKILEIKWPDDGYSFVDIDIWKQLQGKSLKIDMLTLGIKGYGQGALFGGIGHSEKWTAYRNDDSDLAWLKEKTGESFSFYERFTR